MQSGIILAIPHMYYL